MHKQKNSRHLINHLVHSLHFEHVLTLFWLFCVIYIAKFHVTSFFLLFIVLQLKHVWWHTWLTLCYYGMELLQGHQSYTVRDTLIYPLSSYCQFCLHQDWTVSLPGLRLFHTAGLLSSFMGQKRLGHFLQSPADNRDALRIEWTDPWAASGNTGTWPWYPVSRGWLEASHLTALGFKFLTYKMRIMISALLSGLLET